MSSYSKRVKEAVKTLICNAGENMDIFDVIDLLEEMDERIDIMEEMNEQD